MTVYQRFRRWSEAGIWEAVATTLAWAMADNSRHSLDSTTVRGHVSAAGAKGGLANKLLAVRGAGSPVKFIVSVAASRALRGGA
jgi:transposase